MRVAVTGHRPQRLNGKEAVVGQWLSSELKNLLEEDRAGRLTAYTGMAQGVDQIFALQCLKLNIPVYCIYPYERKNFHPEEEYIIEQAAGVVSLQSHYSRNSYYKRDCYLVDNCDILLAVYDGIPVGGTYLTVEYAKKQNKPIIYLPQEILKKEGDK
jgi:predicted Rossmann fold nucleotide-binding protein DprA/Smf involved in DNA uptake